MASQGRYGSRMLRMARAWVVAPVVAVGVACGSSSTTATPDAGSDPCAGLGCAVGLPSLTVAVVDAVSGAVVPAPVFSDGGKALTAQCVQTLAADAGAPADASPDASGDGGAAPACAKWQMSLAVGKHTVTVAAPGYAAASLDLDLKGPPGCCGQGDQVEKTVALTTP